jgi:hypothetical protein
MFKNSAEYNKFLLEVAQDLGALNEGPTKIRGTQIEISEEIKTSLNEADGEVEPLDKVGLFQDLADIQSSLSDAYAKLYVYKLQAIQNPQLLQALQALRAGVDDLLKKTNSTMSFIGLAGDQPAE